MDNNMMNLVQMQNNINEMMTPELIKTLESFSKMHTMTAQAISDALMPCRRTVETLQNMMTPYEELCINVNKIRSVVVDVMNNVSIPVLNLSYDNIIPDEEPEICNTNEKMIVEILQPDQEKKIDIEESPIITLSPINDKVLKYLSENPDAFYQLSDNDFEIVMAEIYSKLGYDVTRTQATRDGGKDLIIRKAETLGDFIYYVECKKYAPKRHIGVGIVKNLVATVDTDKVNGGILATTSFFTKDARQFILDNKWNCQIQLHDYTKIKDLLNMTI